MQPTSPSSCAQIFPPCPPLARSNNTNSDHRGSSYLTNALRKAAYSANSFRNFMSGGSVVVFPLSKMNILRDEGRGAGAIFYFRTPLRVLAGALVHLFGLTSDFSWRYRQGGAYCFRSYILFVTSRRSNQNFRHLAWVSTPPASLNHAPSTSRSSTLMSVLVPA